MLFIGLVRSRGWPDGRLQNGRPLHERVRDSVEHGSTTNQSRPYRVPDSISEKSFSKRKCEKRSFFPPPTPPFPSRPRLIFALLVLIRPHSHPTQTFLGVHHAFLICSKAIPLILVLTGNAFVKWNNEFRASVLSPRILCSNTSDEDVVLCHFNTYSFDRGRSYYYRGLPASSTAKSSYEFARGEHEYGRHYHYCV